MVQPRTVNELGAELGRWVTGLDHTDQVVWALLRFEDVFLGDRLADVHLRLKLLRRQLAPRITVSQVLAVDALLEDGAWKDPDAELSAFRDAYRSVRTWRRRDPIPSVWLEPPIGRTALEPRVGAITPGPRRTTDAPATSTAPDPATGGPNRG